MNEILAMLDELEKAHCSCYIEDGCLYGQRCSIHKDISKIKAFIKRNFDK